MFLLVYNDTFVHFRAEGWQHVQGGAKPGLNATPSPILQTNSFMSRTSANSAPPPLANSIFSKTSSNAYRPPAARGETNIVASNPRPVQPVEEKKPDEKKPGKYVPPNRR